MVNNKIKNINKMNQALQISLTAIGVAVALVVGASAGFVYEKQALTPSLIKAEKVASDMRSQVIGAITAYGKITKIDGRTLTIKAGNDSLLVVMESEAVFFENITQKDKKGKITTSKKKIEFKELKIGFLVGVPVKVSSNGQLNGQSVTVFGK